MSHGSGLRLGLNSVGLMRHGPGLEGSKTRMSHRSGLGTGLGLKIGVLSHGNWGLTGSSHEYWGLMRLSHEDWGLGYRFRQAQDDGPAWHDANLLAFSFQLSTLFYILISFSLNKK